VEEYFEYVEKGWKKHPPKNVWRSGLEKDQCNTFI
jgi:hypothetical protein